MKGDDDLINLLRLKYFITVAESGSFSEAAELLYTTQSAVSKQVIALEKELNTQLFDRSRRKIELTQQGLVALKHAKLLHESYNSLITDLSSFENYDGGNLLIASIPVMAQYNITGLLAEFQKLYPNINMSIEEREGSEIITALKNRQYDLAFMRGEMIDNEFDMINICEDFLIAVLPLEHPLSEKNEISLSQLKEDKFLLLNKGTLLFKSCVSACEDAGFTPSIAYTGTRMENIAEMVAKGMGVTLMMKQAILYLHNDKVAVIPLKEKLISHISLVCPRKKQMTTAAKTFWNYVKSITAV